MNNLARIVIPICLTIAFVGGLYAMYLEGRDAQRSQLEVSQDVIRACTTSGRLPEIASDGVTVTGCAK